MIGLRADRPAPGALGGPSEPTPLSDPHAAGTPGGGTAVGGLAGTNVGTGEPDDDLEDAMGSGNFYTTIETESDAVTSSRRASRPDVIPAMLAARFAEPGQQTGDRREK